MDRQELLSQQGLYTDAHRKIQERLEPILEDTTVKSGDGQLAPLMTEHGDFAVSPLGAIVLASGANVGRTPDPGVYALDDGVYLPGPAFQERTGLHPTIPFSLAEISQYAGDDPDAQFFQQQYQAAGGGDWDGWTTVAHLATMNVNPMIVANLMALSLRSMYDPYFRAPKALRREIARFEKIEKRQADRLVSPEDWMPPPARRLMRFFRGA